MNTMPAPDPSALPRVLLVEDDELNRITLEVLLEESGYEVVAASSLATARRKLTDGAYDVAILDLHLGDGLGSALIGDLRQAHPRAVLALISGETDALRTDGVDLVLVKGNDPGRFLRDLRTALSRRPLRPRPA